MLQLSEDLSKGSVCFMTCCKMSTYCVLHWVLNHLSLHQFGVVYEPLSFVLALSLTYHLGMLLDRPIWVNWLLCLFYQTMSSTLRYVSSYIN